MASSSINVPDASLTNPDGFPSSGATATIINSLTKELMNQLVVFKGRVHALLGLIFIVEDEEGHLVRCRPGLFKTTIMAEFLRDGSDVMIEGIVIPSYFHCFDFQEVEISVTNLYYSGWEVAAKNRDYRIDKTGLFSGRFPFINENLSTIPKFDRVPMDMSMDTDVQTGYRNVVRDVSAVHRPDPIEKCFLLGSRIPSLMDITVAFDGFSIIEGGVHSFPAWAREGDHVISLLGIDDLDAQIYEPKVVKSTSLFFKAFNFMKTNISRAKIISEALNVLEVLGSEKLTKSALNLTAQMTGCLTASYFANSNGQLPKSLLYSAAAANTVGFLGSCAGIALRDNEPRAASIVGGIGTVFAAATFMMVMGTFIPNN